MANDEGNPWVGFWRRLGAFAIDGLLLSLIGAAISAVAFAPLARLGSWGRLIGLAIALAYFGVLGSRIGGGQTVGKRLLKLRVVDMSGETLTLGGAMARAFLLVLPIIVNGISAPLSSNFLVYALVAVAGLGVFGLGPAQLYLLIFNRPSRRMLHDLVANSAVVRSDVAVAAAPFAAVHLRIAMGIIGVVFVLLCGLGFYGYTNMPKQLGSLSTALKAVEARPEVISGGIANNTTAITSSEGKRVTRTRVILARLNRWPADQRAEAESIARTAAVAAPPEPGQGVAVTLSYGVELGIAGASRAYTMPITVAGAGESTK